MEQGGGLTRDEFRNMVFARDQHRCVICNGPAQDAHHIIERRLFTDGGYYLDNGASLCGEHHLAAEATTISTEEIRKATGISHVVLPNHFYDDQVYDKWGNIILDDATRIPGELFYDYSVQKVLDPKVQWRLYTKYPRTFHLPWSPGVGKDDRIMSNDSPLLTHSNVILTEKMDGENTTMYRDHIHARSVESANHPSRGWVKALHASIQSEIPEGYRLCGENLYAKHSIRYNDLPSYFILFSVWDHDQCLPWDETLEWAELLGLQVVPYSTVGSMQDAEYMTKVWQGLTEGHESEGYVIRTAEAFGLRNFSTHCGKYVRSQHVRTLEHWINNRVETNGLTNA